VPMSPVTEMARPNPVTVPSVTVGAPGLFKALPIAMTDWPTVTLEEFPRGAVVSPEAPSAWRTAMSWVASAPTTVALYVCELVEAFTVIDVEPSMTWLLVRISPVEVSTIPVPAAWPFW